MAAAFLTAWVLMIAIPSGAQDWIKTGTGLGVERIRIAVPDFKASSQDPRDSELLRTFNDTLWNDLNNAGIFEMVSKSFYPLVQVGAPADVKFETWSAPPPNAAMLVFGNLAANANNVTVQGWLDDAKNTACYAFTYENIGKPTAAHIHTGAKGVAGPPIVDFKIVTNGDKGCVPVDPTTLKTILSNPGGHYVNIHTSDFGNGAMRGQLAKG